MFRRDVFGFIKAAWHGVVQVDTSLGEMMNFGVLVESFGIVYDRSLAVKLATRHCLKCLKLGGKWHDIDPMTDAIRFLKLRQTYATIMTEKWAQYEKYTTTVRC